MKQRRGCGVGGSHMSLVGVLTWFLARSVWKSQDVTWEASKSTAHPLTCWP